MSISGMARAAERCLLGRSPRFRLWVEQPAGEFAGAEDAPSPPSARPLSTSPLDPAVTPSVGAFAATAVAGMIPLALGNYVWDQGFRRGDGHLSAVMAYATPLCSALLLASLGAALLTWNLLAGAVVIVLAGLPVEDGCLDKAPSNRASTPRDHCSPSPSASSPRIMAVKSDVARQIECLPGEFLTLVLPFRGVGTHIKDESGNERIGAAIILSLCSWIV